MDLVYEDDKDLVAQNWTDLVNGQPRSFEMRWNNRQPGGEPTWVLSASVPFFGEDGKVTSIHGCNTDISAQKKTEHAAVQRADALDEQRFLRFTELADVGVFILDPQHQVRQSQDTKDRLLTVSATDAILQRQMV